MLFVTSQPHSLVMAPRWMVSLSNETRPQLGTAVISIQNPSGAAAELQLLAALKRSRACKSLRGILEMNIP